MAVIGFLFVRRSLVFLNLLLILLSTVLLSVSIYANSVSIVSTSVLGGLIFCAVFLFVIALVGLIGTLKHHQVLLFFYMLMLLICFIIQFVIAIVCLALISNSSRYDLLQTGWANLDNETRRHTEFKYNCCGFDNSDYLKFKLKTEYMSECPSTAEEPCFHALESSISKALKATGICALIFSFTNFFGIWMAMRFRNQRDPKCNPNEFL